MKKSKRMCVGCYNNEYNFGLGGAKECWSYEDAKIVPKITMSINESPPYNKDRAKPTMSCYHQSQMAYVSPDALKADGYWKS